jgi:hypothetical protein
MAGFADAWIEAASRTENRLAAFRLEDFVARLLAIASNAPTPAEHRLRMFPHDVALRAERHLAAAAGTRFASGRHLRRALDMQAASKSCK